MHFMHHVLLMSTNRLHDIAAFSHQKPASHFVMPPSKDTISSDVSQNVLGMVLQLEDLQNKQSMLAQADGCSDT